MEVGEENGLAYILVYRSQSRFAKCAAVTQPTFYEMSVGRLGLPTCFVMVFPACTLHACLWRLASKLGLLQVEHPWLDLPLHAILPRASLLAQLAFKAAAQLQRGLEADVGSQKALSTALLAVHVSCGNRAVYCAHVEDGASGASSLQSLQAAQSLAAQVIIETLFLCLILVCMTCLAQTLKGVGRGTLLAAVAKLHQLIKPAKLTGNTV